MTRADGQISNRIETGPMLKGQSAVVWTTALLPLGSQAMSGDVRRIVSRLFWTDSMHSPCLAQT